MSVAAASTRYTASDQDMVLAHASSYVMRFRDIAHDDRPREKLTRDGPNGLSLAELVAIVWGAGTKKEDVLAMAQRVFCEYGSRALAAETDPTRLADALAIPTNKALQLIACFELGRRFYQTDHGKPVYVRTAEQAYSYFSDMGTSAKEQLRGIYLTSRYQVVHDEVISVGSLTANIVHPREVFQPAIAHGAVAVIVAHNHPSGDPTPTSEDIGCTSQLRAAGTILGIDLLDHIVITSQTYRSVLEAP